MKPGDKVEVTIYNKVVRGAVEHIGPRSGIVFVRREDTGRIGWFHAESVRLVED